MKTFLTALAVVGILILILAGMIDCATVSETGTALRAIAGGNLKP